MKASVYIRDKIREHKILAAMTQEFEHCRDIAERCDMSWRTVAHKLPLMIKFYGVVVKYEQKPGGTSTQRIPLYRLP